MSFFATLPPMEAPTLPCGCKNGSFYCAEYTRLWKATALSYNVGTGGDPDLKQQLHDHMNPAKESNPMGKPDPMTYNEPTTPHTLTDERAGYDALSEAAKQIAYLICDLEEWRGIWSDQLFGKVARLFDTFAGEAVEAWKTDAIAALEQQKIPPPYTLRINLYNLTLDDAIGIIRKM